VGFSANFDERNFFSKMVFLSKVVFVFIFMLFFYLLTVRSIERKAFLPFFKKMKKLQFQKSLMLVILFFQEEQSSLHPFFNQNQMQTEETENVEEWK